MPSVTEDRLTGKSGYISVIDEHGGNRVKIPFVSWSATTTTVFADRTNTGNFSKTANVIFRSSVPVAQSAVAEVAGRYRRDVTPPNVIAQLYKNDKPFRVELGFSPLDPYMDMYAWVEKFEPVVAAEGVVNFSCTLRSEGEITDLTGWEDQQNPPAVPIEGPGGA